MRHPFNTFVELFCGDISHYDIETDHSYKIRTVDGMTSMGTSGWFKGYQLGVF